jgi:hypothetical protein
MQIERVEYQINWKKFKKGWSFFIPCLKPVEAKSILLAETKRFKYRVVTKITIEDGVRGIRIWKV